MLIVDGHCDTLWAARRQGRDWFAAVRSRACRSRTGCSSAGVNIQFMALFSDPGHRGPGFALKALEMIESFYAGIECRIGTRRRPPP